MDKTNKIVIAALLAVACLTGAAAQVLAQEPTSTTPTVEVETRTLDELYQAALQEGGNLVVFAGGDSAGDYAETEKAFKARFPEMNIRIITDLSKYHDLRIDQQIALGRLEFDVAHLQSIHDYDRWKALGLLELYKPLGWDAVYSEFKDPDGAFTAITIFSFSNNVSASLPEADTPLDALDYLAPELKGKLVLTYPQDDDAVLFMFDQIIRTYGWEYIDKLMQQDVQWVRGTVPALDVVRAGQKLATFTAAGALTPDSASRFVLPAKDSFLIWPQMAAIFRASPHKEAARLYLSWTLDKETIAASPFQWVVRRDVDNPEGFKPVFAYNADSSAFRRFMDDRGHIERLRGRLEMLIGPAVGENPTGVEGVYLLDSE